MNKESAWKDQQKCWCETRQFAVVTACEYWKFLLIHCDKKESKICLSKANSRNSQNEAVRR